MRARVALLVLVLVAAGCATPGFTPADLRAELEAMYDSDQSHRTKLQELALKGEAGSPQFVELLMQQQAADAANLKKLGEIVAATGWPGRSQVGEKGTVAAFLIVQHADPATRKQYLPLVRAAVAAGEARPEDLALLEDRVLVDEGRKQRFGSQLQPRADGSWEFYPIEDEASVDARRKAVGLPPLAEYAKQMGVQYPR